MTGRLTRHIAVVTGAGSGIGRAVALRLASEGARVTVNDLRAETAHATAGIIRGTGGEAVAVGGDVSDETAVRAIFAGAQEAFGAVTLAVSNAGIVQQARFTELTVDDWDRMIAVHLRGAFLVSRHAIGAMLERRSGVIVNIASQLGQIGGIELVHYSAAKAGIIGLTKALAREVGTSGVRVNAVAPGPINTELVMALSEEWRAAKASALPLGRFGEPEEVAATVAFLASDDAELYVGQTLGPNAGDVML